MSDSPDEVLTITPDPKYLANLDRTHTSQRETTAQKVKHTDSQTETGILSHRDLRASTGNSAPKVPPAQMTKTEPMRRPVRPEDPVETPQASSSDMAEVGRRSEGHRKKAGEALKATGRLGGYPLGRRDPT
jgi:hypothetical protein